MGGFFRIPGVRTLYERRLLLPAVLILVVSGVLAEPCGRVLKAFFAQRR